MVSIHLDIIKFLLIYRHLQNTYWFQRDAVQEGVGIAFSDVVVNCQSVRETDCSVVGVASSAGVTEG